MSGWYSPHGGRGGHRGRPGPPGPGPGRGQATPDLDDRAELIAQRRARRRARTRRVATGAAGIGGLLVLWQAAAMLLGDQVALPSVTQTVAQFAHYLNRPYPAQGKPLWYDLYISLRRILVGFVIGVAAGSRSGRRCRPAAWCGTSSTR